MAPPLVPGWVTPAWSATWSTPSCTWSQRPSSPARSCTSTAATRACRAPASWPAPSARPARPPSWPWPATAPGLPLKSEAQLAGDEHPLDLGRALADLQDLGVAVEAADRVFVHEAVAAEDLGGVAGVVHGGVGGGQLGDGRFLLERLPGQHPGRRGVVGQPGHVGASFHVGDLELQTLEPADRAAERVPVMHVTDGLVDAALGEPGRQVRDGDPDLFKGGQELG